LSSFRSLNTGEHPPEHVATPAIDVVTWLGSSQLRQVV
jgi:hypothetical protein